METPPVSDSPPYPPALEGRTLLDELNHRIKNELASVINLVTFKAVWTDNADAKEELSNVVDLLHQHVEVHSILTIELPRQRQRIGRGKDQARSRPAHCRRSGREPGWPDRPHLRHDLELVRPGLSSDATRAARQPRGRRPPPQNRSSAKDDAVGSLRVSRKRTGKSDRRSATTLRSKEIYNVDKDSSHPDGEPGARRRHRRSQRGTRAVRPSSGTSACLRWSASRPRCRWSSSGSRRRRCSPRWRSGRTCRWLSAPRPRGRTSARHRRWSASRGCWRIAWPRPRRPGQFSRRRRSRRGLQRQQLHPQ